MEISTTAQPGSSGQRTPTPLGICKPSFILLSWSTSNAPRYQVFFGIRRGQRNCAFKLGPHVAASLRTEAFPDGMSAFLLPAHIIVRNARGFEKTLSQRRAAEVHVSVLKAGSKTRMCLKSSGRATWAGIMFMFTIVELQAQFPLRHIWKSVCLHHRYTSTLLHTVVYLRRTHKFSQG